MEVTKSNYVTSMVKMTLLLDTPRTRFGFAFAHSNLKVRGFLTKTTKGLSKGLTMTLY